MRQPWPRDLVILYPIQIWSAWQIIGAALVLVAISAAAFKLLTRRPYFAVGWLWFLGVLVPVIGLVHVGSQSMADRYTYLPLIGIFVATTWGAVDLLRSPKMRTALAVLALGFSLTLTRAQVALWVDSETLFRHALRHTRQNVLIQNNLAAEYIEQGRLDEGIALLQEAIAANPNLANTLANLGSALERKGQIDEAMALYERSVQLNPRHAEAQNNLGFLLLMRGDLDQAVPHFLTALQFQRFP